MLKILIIAPLIGWFTGAFLAIHDDKTLPAQYRRAAYLRLARNASIAFITGLLVGHIFEL